MSFFLVQMFQLNLFNVDGITINIINKPSQIGERKSIGPPPNTEIV